MRAFQLFVPQQQAVSKAHEAFAANGALADAKAAAMLAGVVNAVLKLAAQRSS